MKLENLLKAHNQFTQFTKVSGSNYIQHKNVDPSISAFSEREELLARSLGLCVFSRDCKNVMVMVIVMVMVMLTILVMVTVMVMVMP